MHSEDENKADETKRKSSNSESSNIDMGSTQMEAKPVTILAKLINGIQSVDRARVQSYTVK